MTKFIYNLRCTTLIVSGLLFAYGGAGCVLGMLFMGFDPLERRVKWENIEMIGWLFVAAMTSLPLAVACFTRVESLEAPE